MQCFFLDRQAWNSQVYQRLLQFQQKYNNMSDIQTLSLLNNDTQNRNFVQSEEFQQKSVKNQSIILGDLAQSPKQLRENAFKFLQTYKKLDQTFPMHTLKESLQLKVKFYKESAYYGELHNGKKQGLGIMVYKNGRIYEGQWSNQQKKGYGAELFPNACIYKGQYFNGKAGGAGTYIWPNGERYDGQWVNGFKHGSGMWRGQKGDCYKGEWKFGKPQGYGVHTWPNGDNYEGQFKECLKHGQGIERFANGDMYKGRYINGKPSGYGEYYWFNGSYFKGNFINGLRDGKGFWKRGVGNSDTYQGAYKNDKKWGYGVFKWATGNTYKGNYEADSRNGYGDMYWINGCYYKGNWMNGIQNGEGQIFVPKEGYKKGLFENNKIVEIWEERIAEKKSNHKTKFRMKTQNPVKSRLKGRDFYGRDNNKFKRYNDNNQQKTYVYSATNAKRLAKQRLSVNQAQKQRFSQQQKRHQYSQEQQKYCLKSKISQSRTKKRIKTNINSDYQMKKGQSLQEQQPNSGKHRLLHSSFYLYKLNMRHNVQTMKNLKKTQEEQKNKPSMLFMGQLYPS